MSKKKYETLHGDIEAVYMKVIRFYGDWGDTCTIPLSLIENGEELDEGPNQDINVESWFVEKEGLG